MLSPTLRELIAGRPLPGQIGVVDCDLAVDCGLGPLLLAGVKEQHIDLPPDLRHELATAELAWRADSDRHLEAIKEARSIFHAHQLPFRIYKGLANGQMLYASASHRRSADVDVAVSVDDGPGLGAALRALGFPAVQTAALIGLANRGRPLHEAAVRASNQAAFIDVHFNLYGLLTPPHIPDLSDWFVEGELPEVGSVLLPLPELAFVVSSVNLARKGGLSLTTAADMARLLQGAAGDLRWDRIDTLLEVEGLGSIVAQSAWAVVEDLALTVDLPLDRPQRRAWWAPRLGEPFRRGPRQPTLLPLHRPMRHWGESVRATQRWYFPGEQTLNAMGEQTTGSTMSRTAGRLVRKWNGPGRNVG